MERSISPEIAAAIEAQVLALQPCDETGIRLGGGTGAYARPAWTPLGFQRRGDRFILVCQACGHAGEAPLQALIDDGKGDWPWARFSGKWRCTAERCGSMDVKVELELKR